MDTFIVKSFIQYNLILFKRFVYILKINGIKKSSLEKAQLKTFKMICHLIKN